MLLHACAHCGVVVGRGGAAGAGPNVACYHLWLRPTSGGYQCLGFDVHAQEEGRALRRGPGRRIKGGARRWIRVRALRGGVKGRKRLHQGAVYWLMSEAAMTEYIG
jgi:hypothetical protein